MTTCTIVVPCYNEALRLDMASFQRFTIAHPGCHFLFVDDCSTDGTGEILEAICRCDAQCRSLTLSKNGGKAAAVRAGMLAALANGSDCVGFWDADLATPLDAIPLFIERLTRNPNVQLVCGARVKLLGRHVHRQPIRHYLGRLFATVASHVLRLPIYDTQCGAKLFRNNEETLTLFDQPFRTSWVFDVEILARMWDYRVRTAGSHLAGAIYELPLEEWHDVAGSKVRPRDFVRAIGQLLDIHRHYRPARMAQQWRRQEANDRSDRRVPALPPAKSTITTSKLRQRALVSVQGPQS